MRLSGPAWGVEAILEASLVPNLDGGSSKLTCYPRVVGPAHDAVCNLEEQRGRSERHHLQNGSSGPGPATCARHSEDRFAFLGGREKGLGGYAAGAGTRRFSFSGVV